VSYCTSAACVAHRRPVFIRLDQGERYPWVHTDLWPCEAMPAASAREAGEVCACGHVPHEATPGPLPYGLIAKPRPCLECPCPDFRDEWQAAS
jgi:hypothetical protein